jgi:hypothetical protein
MIIQVLKLRKDIYDGYANIGASNEELKRKAFLD